MGGAPPNIDAPTLLTFMRVNHLHGGRLPDDAHGRFDGLLRQHIQEPAYTNASDLFIIGKRKMHWRQQGLFHHLRHFSQRAGNKALHVGGSPSEKRPILLTQHKRIC